MKDNNEKLSLWDRFFNRYKKVIVQEGTEGWTSRRRCPYTDVVYEQYDYSRRFVKYKIVDRVTGSETIKIEYLT